MDWWSNGKIFAEVCCKWKQFVFTICSKCCKSVETCCTHVSFYSLSVLCFVCLYRFYMYDPVRYCKFHLRLMCDLHRSASELKLTARSWCDWRVNRQRTTRLLSTIFRRQLKHFDRELPARSATVSYTLHLSAFAHIVATGSATV